MRTAVFSDVHGNLTGLKAVLEHIEEQGEVDQVIFAGDLCVAGPRPLACLDLIREKRIPSIIGNTDEWITHPPPALGNEASDAQKRKRDLLRATCDWTRDRLGERDLAWFSEMNTPFQRRYSPTPNPRDDLLVVHANPSDLMATIFPSEDRQQTLYGRVRQSDAEVETMLGDTVCGVMAFGHLHIPNVRQAAGMTLVNVSSVSMPGDGDGRAKYALLTWDGGGWTVEHVYVSYAVEAEIAAFRENRPPGWEKRVEQLQTLGFVPQ